MNNSKPETQAIASHAVFYYKGASGPDANSFGNKPSRKGKLNRMSSPTSQNGISSSISLKFGAGFDAAGRALPPVF